MAEHFVLFESDCIRFKQVGPSYTNLYRFDNLIVNAFGVEFGEWIKVTMNEYCELFESILDTIFPCDYEH